MTHETEHEKPWFLYRFLSPCSCNYKKERERETTNTIKKKKKAEQKDVTEKYVFWRSTESETV